MRCTGGIVPSQRDAADEERLFISRQNTSWMNSSYVDHKSIFKAFETGHSRPYRQEIPYD